MAGIPASSKLARRGARASATSRSLSSFSWRMSISCRCSSAISNCRTVNIRTTAIPRMNNKAANKPYLHHSIPLLAQSNLGIRFATLRLAVCDRLLVRLLVRLKKRYRKGALEYAAHIYPAQMCGCASSYRVAQTCSSSNRLRSSTRSKFKLLALFSRFFSFSYLRSQSQ